MSAPIRVSSRRRRVSRDDYGSLDKDKRFLGMQTKLYSGRGEQLVENMFLESGKYRKMSGNTGFKDVGELPLEIFDYRKTDGTHQELYIFEDSGTFKLRALDAGTILTPTGGAGDVAFTNSLISYEQIGDTGLIACDSGSTILYTWNGTQLTAVTGVDPNIIGLASDGRRAAAIFRDGAKFSSDGIISSNVWAGTGVNADGDYNINVRPTAILTAGAGVIIFGDVGAEAHFVRPNDASDDVSSKTKIESFNYKGRGVMSQGSVVSGRSFVYFYNEEGLRRLNPYDGVMEDLVDQNGAIEKYWKILDTTFSKLKYSQKESVVVMSIAEIGGSNDRLLCYFEETSSISFKTRVYSSGLGDVNNQLLSGEGTSLISIFDDQTFTDKDDQVVKARIITEWNTVGDPFVVKRFLKSHYMANLSPDSAFTASIYVNGFTDSVHSNTFTTSDVIDNSGAVALLGKYILAKGGGSLLDNSLQINRTRQLNKLTMYCTEIVEESVDLFEIISIAAQTSSYGTENINLTQADTLFPFSS